MGTHSTHLRDGAGNSTLVYDELLPGTVRTGAPGCSGQTAIMIVRGQHASPVGALENGERIADDPRLGSRAVALERITPFVSCV